MRLKTCKQCGWQQAAEDPSRRCHGCNAPVTEGICNECGFYCDDLSPRQYLCRDCEKDRSKEKCARSREKTMYGAHRNWVADVKKIPTPYSFLTEEQWLSACAHFEGCAFCGAESVDTRAFFIHFKDGGRYCDWNVIPKCSKCATSLAYTNAFCILNRSPEQRKLLKGIIAYLEPIMRRRVHEPSRQD